MFSLCPHCQFLLARDPRSGRLPAACPKCGGAIVDDDPPPPAESATGGGEQPDSHEAAAKDAAPPAHHPRRPRRRRTEEAAEDAAAQPSPARAATASPPAAASQSRVPDATTDAIPRRGPEPDPQPDLDLDEATTAADTPARPSPDRSEPAQADSPQDSGPDTAIPPATDPGTAEPSDAAPAAPPATGSSPPSAATAQPPPRPPVARGRRLPSFLQAREPGVRGPRRESAILWSAIGLLALALVMQLLLADRARLAMDAGWRPTLARMCGVLGCDLPPWREPQAFTMLSRDVRAHPQRPGTLRVTTSFRNDARWPQPWPALLLTLSDLDGRVAGARAFAPVDYVEADDRGRLLEPGQVATVTLDVIEPAPGIVAFTFDFR